MWCIVCSALLFLSRWPVKYARVIFGIGVYQYTHFVFLLCWSRPGRLHTMWDPVRRCSQFCLSRWPGTQTTHVLYTWDSAPMAVCR